ncbi:MAG: anaerobic ribonucleoside-triphosphate reductase activating protein [Olsenella sp.]|nr:anaerobic ribonucleoside-triphosphate reductase activating protein [Olsenella sp.]
MNYATIKYCDIANGIGVRTSLFVSGCRLHCKNCFNEEAWSFSAGKPFTQETEEEILASLAAPYVDGLSVLGGEPTEPENATALAPFLEHVRAAYPEKNIWMYSGRTWEQLTGDGDHASPDMDRILACLNVLVDGPFVQELHDITLRFRGSSNQRLIDVPATLATGAITIWEDDPQFAQHAWA